MIANVVVCNIANERSEMLKDNPALVPVLFQVNGAIYIGAQQKGISMNDSVIHVSQEILSGMPVFYGTRVPIKTLFDYLESGDTIENFILDFPTVKRNQVIEVLEIAERNIISSATLNENTIR